MRVFAGPNGSGKSTIFEQIDKNFDIGYYINPDEIEKQLRTHNRLDLRAFGLQDLAADDFSNFTKKHSLLETASAAGYKIDLRYSAAENAVLNPDASTHSYEAALLADFIRTRLIERGKKLTFETVMSHPSKLDIFDLAVKNGYKVYLYFICTAVPDINIARVRQRVQQGGHDVQPEKIRERYFRTLKLLKPAVQKTYRSFVWDNSQKTPELILEVTGGKEVTLRNEYLPEWVSEYLLK
jgi:predicted ABC-type ATPase